MEENMKFDKGVETNDVAHHVEDRITRMLLKEFEDVNAQLKSKISISVNIKEIK